MCQTVLNTLVAQRFTRLTLQRADLTADFLDHIGDTGEIDIDQRELTKRFFALRFVECNTRSLFKNSTTLAGIG